MAYHSSEPDGGFVYHIYPDCPVGEKISPEHLIEGIGRERRMCEQCQDRAQELRRSAPPIR